MLVNDLEDVAVEKLVPGGSTRRHRHTRNHASSETDVIVQKRAFNNDFNEKFLFDICSEGLNYRCAVAALPPIRSIAL